MSSLREKFRKLKMPPRYYMTRLEIPCECPLCRCPSSRKREYTFKYVNGRIVYFDVPKAASTTIRRSLFGPDEAASLRPIWRPKTLQFRFSFVRNPWDRAVSNWKMFTTQAFRIRQLKSMGGSPDMDFNEFLEFSERNINHHWLPQSRYVPDNLDFLGRLESFDRDFERLQEILSQPGEAPPAAAEHLNRTVRKDYRDYYDGRAREIADRMYRDDIERFEYAF